MSVKNPDQRVGVFIDVQNLYYSAKALYGAKVNFDEIVFEIRAQGDQRKRFLFQFFHMMSN